MSAASPTFSQIKAQVTAIRQKVPKARVIGIHSPVRWTGQPDQPSGDVAYSIQQCDSPLALRMALRNPVSEGTTKVLITPLDDAELSQDILVRLAKRKLYQIDSWQIVRSLFQAHAVDPRLTRHSWMADALLESIHSGEYPAARGGFLDAETVWPLVLSSSIGLTADTSDLPALLRWSLDVEGTSRFRVSPSQFREAAVEWLTAQGGPTAGLVLASMTRWERPDAVPLGLAAGVVLHPASGGRLEKAVGKLEERFLGGATPDAGLAQRWSAAATELVRALRHSDPRAYRQILQRADDILREVGAESSAYLSNTSPLGFDQRLAAFGQQLGELAAHGTWGQSARLTDAWDAIRSHDQAAQDARRVERVEMAVRLVRWLAVSNRSDSTAPRSLGQAADEHLGDGSFVDWARLRLRAGDGMRELSEAYAQLFEAVTTVRERTAQHFGQLLVDWTSAVSPADGFVPVEQVLDEFVAPLAADRGALVIVIDGMSAAVWRELQADVARQEWTLLSESGRTRNRPALATVPSVTEYSRTSLLCGRLQRGAAGDEQAGFTQHPALLATCRNGIPAILFHKVSLQEAQDAVLAADVRDAIQSARRRVVGVVINAVDDHLFKGDQLDVRWSRDEIRVLPVLLHEARTAGRIVVLVSDHGHVLDYRTEGRPAEGGERWRLASGVPAHGELLIQGPRVLTEGQRLIAPWSERVRYAGKKNGYHGGLNPQEMVVPIVVLSSTDDLPIGWQEQPVDVPQWWDEPVVALPIADQSVPRLKPARTPPSRTLFDLEAEERPTTTVTVMKASAPGVTATPSTPTWVSRLFNSPVYEQQKQLVGRGVPADDLLARLLTSLDARGGKLTTMALARALAFPEVRLPGLLAKVQRLLNIDGYAVLNRDDASQTVELNRDLLLKQFDLSE